MEDRLLRKMPFVFPPKGSHGNSSKRSQSDMWFDLPPYISLGSSIYPGLIFFG